MTETTNRVLDLMKKRGLNARQLELSANLPNSSVQNWTKGKKCKNGEIRHMSPSTEAVAKLARYFNVSADYLLFLTDEPKPLIQADLAERPTYALSTEFAELLQEKRFVDTAKVYKELPNEYRQEIYAYIIGIAVGLGLNVEKILGR